MKFDLTPKQCRAARGVLNWTVKRLAEEAGLSGNTVLAFEHGRSTRPSTPLRLQDVFAKAGVKLTRHGVATEQV